MLAVELLCNSLCGPLPKTLKSPGLYELDRLSQKHRRGCHCWELQNEPFAFCGRIDTECVDLRNKVFSSHWSVSAACDQGTKISSKKIEVLCLAKAVFPGQTLKAVFPASEHKYIAAGGDLQVPPWGRGGIHEWRKSEQTDWCTDW